MPVTFQPGVILVLCLRLISLIAATRPARTHEARQGHISIEPLSFGPGPVSLQTSLSTSTTPKATTMSPTSTDPGPASSSSSAISPSSSSSQAASRSSSEASSATPRPSQSPSGIIFAVQDMTTCTSGLISWYYSGTDAALSLSITNVSVNYTSFRIKARQSTVNTTIQQQLVVTNASAQSWTWPSVDVTEGWYKIEGVISTTPIVQNNSAPFFVSNGTTVSCLTDTSPQASSSVSPSSASFATSNLNVASIVGSAIGGGVGIMLVIIAGLCLWGRKRRFVGGGRSKDRKWGSLNSTNSSIRQGRSGVQVASSHFHAHSSSAGAMIPVDPSGKPSPTITPGGSDEDVTTTGEEKVVSSASSSVLSPLDALNIPLHHDRRDSTYSVHTPTTVTNEGTRSRSASRCISNQSLEQQAQRIRCSMEKTPVRRRSERLSMPTLPSPSLSRIRQSPTVTQAREEYPLTPITPTHVNRSISTGAVSTTPRRASRKPVPHYDPSLLEDASADSVSTFTAGAESSQSHGTGILTGVYGTPPDLVHKASFGDGRPVHYLIPDMPMPQQD